MDAIMDLTARAVSFITLIQDCFLRASVTYNNKELAPGLQDVFGQGFKEKFSNHLQEVKAYEKKSLRSRSLEPDGSLRPVGFEVKLSGLVWMSEKNPDDEDKKVAEQYIIELCTGLVEWIAANNGAIEKKIGPFGAFASPYMWRDAISEIIYSHVDQRLALAETMEYLPIHMVLALGGANYEANEQRILQWWETGKKQNRLSLTETEERLHHKFREVVYKKFQKEAGVVVPNQTLNEATVNNFYFERIQVLLGDYQELTNALLNKEAPLSFEYVFTDELEEIIRTRKLRKKERLLVEVSAGETITGNGNGTFGNAIAASADGELKASHYSCDPFVKAKEMKLFALAFSGGGIRSATFNLGILQGLAKKGIISDVDYLSTVSGGGYIGSWLATWIKREGSVTKVMDRLNPEKSPDPLGEEVRPIRWLRMFSNYFTPNKSIMSVDSWTVGVTWLRNTLLNQLVIFLVLLAVLLFTRTFYELWFHTTIWNKIFPGSYVYVTACVFLLVLAFFIGIGMQWYSKGRSTNLPFNLQKNNAVSFIVSLIAIAGSYIVSASLYAQPESAFGHKLLVLLPAAFITLLILVVIAAYGRYDRCIEGFGRSGSRSKFIIFYTAVFAAAVGWLALAAAWEIFELIKKAHIQKPEALGFSAGLSIVLLVFGVTVVARMALLGKYFPDERREWWGRMGAVINRVAFIWVLVAAATYLLRDVLNPLLSSWKAPVTLGGWMALVGGTVKAAFSSNTSGKESTKGFQALTLNILSKAGPYLFVLGLLIFLPSLVEPLIRKPIFPQVIEGRIWLKAIILAVIFFVPGFYLSWRLGVNEFSMHHFYRNRLVRAYLGATRRKSSREKTANPFTGFDRYDDEKLAVFTCDQGYHGPYIILNTALNASQVSDLSRQDRKAESFIFSPLYCGFDFSKVRSAVNSIFKSYDYGFRPTGLYAYPNDGGPGIGTAMAISGAAVNPNQGYHSSAGTAFLLTVFNVQMGWWIGNPRKWRWQQCDPDFGLGYIIYNLAGQTNTRNEFLCLSDGGHFDNMGLYEMVRRRCAFIILGDGEQDENFTCEGFANAIRRCRIDFGAEIRINIDNIIKRENHYSKQHYAIGTIKYSGDTKPTGTLVYIKSSITGNEPVDISEYALKNPTFPHQTTADQFFDEEQFESYRKLGMHIADNVLEDEKLVTALGLKTLENSTTENGREDLEKPVKNLFNTLKNFFVNKPS